MTASAYHPLEAVDARYALGSKVTPVQLRVLAEVATGKTTREVAHTLGRSEQTVKNTLATVRQRLGAADTTHAVALMDDYRPGWRPRLPIPARSSVIPARPLEAFSRPETGPKRAGTAS